MDFFEKNFDIEFISGLSEVFVKRSYSYDDNIIDEDQLGDEIYFIINGLVSMIHKKTGTFLKDLNVRMIK